MGYISLSEIYDLGGEINRIPAGEPVVISQKTEFDQYVFLYVQPDNRVGVEITVASERVGDQIDVHDISLIGLKGPAYCIRNSLDSNLEKYRVPTNPKVSLTSDSERNDDMRLFYGKKSIEEITDFYNGLEMDHLLPLIRQFLEK